MTVYAKGMNPSINKDWYDKTNKVSPDDFYDYPPLKLWIEAIVQKYPRITNF